MNCNTCRDASTLDWNLKKKHKKNLETVTVAGQHDVYQNISNDIMNRNSCKTYF